MLCMVKMIRTLRQVSMRFLSRSSLAPRDICLKKQRYSIATKSVRRIGIPMMLTIGFSASEQRLSWKKEWRAHTLLILLCRIRRGNVVPPETFIAAYAEHVRDRVYAGPNPSVSLLNDEFRQALTVMFDSLSFHV